jgi:hypothetical protein
MGILSSLFPLFQDKREILDLESFEDELAFRISWDPLVGGGTNFCTHRLQKTSGLMNNSIEFKPTFVAYLVSISFAVIGLIAILFTLSSGSMDSGALIALAPLGFGLWSLRDLVKQKSSFSSSSRVFYKNTKSCGFDNISAIQLLREYVRGNKNSYYSYELNLVCINGERINIVDHGALHAIREDASILADYLAIPVWDAIDFRIPDSGSDQDLKTEVLRNNLG